MLPPPHTECGSCARASGTREGGQFPAVTPPRTTFPPLSNLYAPRGAWTLTSRSVCSPPWGPPAPPPPGGASAAGLPNGVGKAHPQLRAGRTRNRRRRPSPDGRSGRRQWADADPPLRNKPDDHRRRRGAGWPHRSSATPRIWPCWKAWASPTLRVLGHLSRATTRWS